MTHLRVVEDDERSRASGPNELDRCRTCGAYTGEELWFCWPGEMWHPQTDLTKVQSFCERSYWSRVDSGLPVTQFRSWAEEQEHRKRQAELGEANGDGVCAGPDCDEPVSPPRRYHGEACRAKAYRHRKQGGQ